MYGIGGETDLTERTLDHLSGYLGSQPGADRQRRVRPAAARRLGDAARLAGAPTRGVAAQSPDTCGLASPAWSIRRSAGARRRIKASGRCAATPKHFVASKVMCWVAADRGAQLARGEGDDERGRSLAEAAADAIKARSCSNGRRRARRVRAALRDHGPRRLEPADPDHGLPAARRRTGAGDGARDRGRADPGRPGPALPGRQRRRRPLDGEEGTFTICSFWLVSALR